MRALTICQPYAHLIVTPHDELPDGVVRKRVENRVWETGYRGMIAIHAGKGLTFLSPGDRRLMPKMVFGAIVGVADLVACVAIAEDGQISPAARERFPWLEDHPHAEGPFGWVLERVRRFTRPIEARGAQSLWDWTPPADWRSMLESTQTPAVAG